MKKQYLKIRFGREFTDGFVAGETAWAYTTDNPRIVEVQNCLLFVTGIDISDLVEIDADSSEFVIDSLTDENGVVANPNPVNVVRLVSKGHLQTSWIKVGVEDVGKIVEILKANDSDELRENFGFTCYIYGKLYAFSHPVVMTEAQDNLYQKIMAFAQDIEELENEEGDENV